MPNKSYNSKDEVPGKFTVVDNGEKDEKGRTKIKIRFRERIKTRTRTRKRSIGTKYERLMRVLQVVLLILGVVALFFAGYQILMSDLNRPVIFKQKVKKPTSDLYDIAPPDNTFITANIS